MQKRQTTKQEEYYKALILSHKTKRYSYISQKYILITKYIKPLCCYRDMMTITLLEKHLGYDTPLDDIKRDLKEFISQWGDNTERAKKVYGEGLINDLMKLRF